MTIIETCADPWEVWVEYTNEGAVRAWIVEAESRGSRDLRQLSKGPRDITHVRTGPRAKADWSYDNLLKGIAAQKRLRAEGVSRCKVFEP